ncbi:trypsin-like serine protease [Bdellovibrio sp. NC01]|uniref:S1 family peptidase n=1 Tax=Bdellovibrio sp. NC01 TaxID=2220073 RepID=UPI001158B634|nr:trypsin-like serine protease [Bdellovibrio sp. NC01]QDK36130.1 trypsin [Bdellovibrio sp. NC01]
MIFNKALTSLAFVLFAAIGVSCSPHQYQTHTAVSGDAQGILGGDTVASDDPVARSTVAVLVTVLSSVDQNMTQYLCAGVIIRANAILTAAHCAPKSDETHQVRIYVVFSKDLNDLGDKDVRNVINQVVHPDFAKKQGPHGEDSHDLAILKYTGTLPLTYRPALIIPNDNILTCGTRVTLAGFGLSDLVSSTSDNLLRSVELPYGQKFGDSEIIFDQSNGFGACHGDSGGPAFVNYNGTYLLWGIISRGVGPNDCLSYGVVSKLTAQASFIKDALKQMGLN